MKLGLIDMTRRVLSRLGPSMLNRYHQGYDSRGIGAKGRSRTGGGSRVKRRRLL